MFRKDRLALLLVAACVCPPLPLRAQFTAADDDFHEGVRNYEAKNYPAAMDRFTHALLLDPANREIRKYIVLTQQGISQQTADPRPEEIQAMVRRAQEVLQSRRKETEETLNLLKMANTESELRNPKSLLEACRGIDIVVDVSLGEDPESVLIKHYVKSICGNLQKTMDARTGINLNRIAKINGYLAFCRSDWAEAIKAWTKALKADPKDRQLAKLLERAKTHLQRADEKAQVGVLMENGVRALATQQYQAAADSFDSALALDPYNHKALTLFKESRSRLADQKTVPIQHWMQLATASQARGDLVAAAGYWINVLEIDPANDDARRNLAKNKTKLLAEVASGASAPERPAESAFAPENRKEEKRLYTLGLIQYSEGNLPAARDSLIAAQKLNPQDEYVQNALLRVQNELQMAR